jgi:hypothetical protein
MYYVYFYKDPITFKIFYIGKGKNNRLYSHWMRRDVHYNLVLKEKLQSICKLNKVPIIEKYKDNLENYEAYYLEFKLISKYGRLGIDDNGILCNRSVGLEHFNIPTYDLVSLKDFLKDKIHFNAKVISESEKIEIINSYVSGIGIAKLAKMYSHGPHTIKRILLESNITLKTRGGQTGKANGMYGVKRENTNYFKGRKHTAESRKKISMSLKGLTAKKLIVNSIVYNSVHEAAITVNIPRQTLTRYAKFNKPLFRNGKIYNVQYI